MNTKNANYSYGSLQQILKFGLKKIALNNCKSILILGLGGGSIIETLLHDFNYKNTITAVDIDPVIIDVANTEFELRKHKNLDIICDDALHFIEQNSKQFDLIVIDLFIDLDMPQQFLNTSFWQAVIKSNSASGNILFNASLHHSKNNKLKNIVSLLDKNAYKVNTYHKVNNTNTLLIANALK